MLIFSAKFLFMSSEFSLSYLLLFTTLVSCCEPGLAFLFFGKKKRSMFLKWNLFNWKFED